MNDKPYNVYFSYSKVDGEAFVKRLLARLLKDKKGRQLKFWKGRSYLKDETVWNKTARAINEVDCLVLVLTPDCLTSDLVGTVFRQQGIEEDWLCLVKSPDFDFNFNHDKLPDEAKSYHVYDTEAEWDCFVDELYRHSQLGKLLNMAPEPPEAYVHRPKLYNTVKRQLLLPTEREGGALNLSLIGAAGAGKSTLAMALCHDREIQEYFDNGILWLSLSRIGNEMEEVTKAYNTITGDSRVFTDLAEATSSLSRQLDQMHQGYLLVVDNVQRSHQLSLFLGWGWSNVKVLSTGPGAVEVRTSRNRYRGEPAIAFSVGEMEEEEAFRLLTRDWELDQEITLVAKELLAEWGHRPLFLKLLHDASLSQAKNSGSLLQVLKLLHKKAWNLKNKPAYVTANEAHLPILEAILSLLAPEQQKRCIDLGFLPAETPIPLSSVYALWGTDATIGEKHIRGFAELRLLDLYETQGVVVIHSVLHLYYKEALNRTEVPKRELLHQVFPDAYDLPNTFAWKRYITELVKAGELSKATALLCDYDWMKAKLEHTDVHNLLHDYQLAPHGNNLLDLLYNAIIMSAVVLALDKSNLPLQLYQRLRFHLKELPESFLDALEKDLKAGPCIPLKTSLHPVGSAIHIAELEAGVAKVVPWRGKAIVGLHSGAIWVVDVENWEWLYPLTGHNLYIEDLVVLGNTLVSSSWDETIRVWDLVEGKALHTFRDQPVMVRKLSVTESLLICGTCSYDKDLDRWENMFEARDLKTGKLLRSIPDTSEYVTGVAVSGNILVREHTEHGIQSWNLDTGEALHTFTEQGGYRSLLCIAGEVLLSCSHVSGENGIRSWHLETGEALHVYKGHEADISCLYVAGDTLISGSDDNTLISWSLSEQRLLHVFRGHTAGIIDISVNEGVIISCSSDYTLRSWDLETGEALRVYYGHADKVNCARLFRDLIVSGSDDTTLKCWSLNKSGMMSSATEHLKMIGALELTKGIAVTGSNDKTLKSWEVATGNLLQDFKGHTGRITAVCTAGDTLISASADGTIRSWYLKTGAPLHTFHGHTECVSGLVVSGNIILSSSRDNTIRSCDLLTGEELQVYKGHTRHIYCLTAAKGKVISGGNDNTIRCWELETGKEVFTTETDNYYTQSIAVTGDNILTSESAPHDGTLRSWSLSTGELLKIFTGFAWDGHVRGTTCFAVSGNTLVSAGAGFDKHQRSYDEYSYTLIRWDLATGEQLHRFLGHYTFISSIQIAGSLCFSGSYDQTIRIWNLKDGSSLATIHTNEAIEKVSFDATAKVLVAGGARGGLFFYRLNDYLSTLAELEI